MRVKMMVMQHTSEIGAVEHRCGVALKSLNEEGNQEMFNYQLAIVFIGSTRQINVKSSSGCNFFFSFFHLLSTTMQEEIALKIPTHCPGVMNFSLFPTYFSIQFG